MRTLIDSKDSKDLGQDAKDGTEKEEEFGMDRKWTWADDIGARPVVAPRAIAQRYVSDDMS
jgi:hypothetical protein